MLAGLSKEACLNPFLCGFCQSLKAGANIESPDAAAVDTLEADLPTHPGYLPIGDTGSKVTVTLASSIGHDFRAVHLPSHRPCSNGEEGIDFTVVLQVMDWFNGHVVQPTFPTQLRWHPSTLPWLDVPRWHLEPPEVIHFYLDGSACCGGMGACGPLHRSGNGLELSSAELS